jgi:hypothetical protein
MNSRELVEKFGHHLQFSTDWHDDKTSTKLILALAARPEIFC